MLKSFHAHQSSEKSYSFFASCIYSNVFYHALSLAVPISFSVVFLIILKMNSNGFISFKGEKNTKNCSTHFKARWCQHCLSADLRVIRWYKGLIWHEVCKK